MSFYMPISFLCMTMSFCMNISFLYMILYLFYVLISFLHKSKSFGCVSRVFPFIESLSFGLVHVYFTKNYDYMFFVWGYIYLFRFYTTISKRLPQTVFFIWSYLFMKHYMKRYDHMKKIWVYIFLWLS